MVEEIQQLIEFAFMVEGKEVPKMMLGDDKNELKNESTRPDDPIQIFIKLTKRCYYNTNTEHGDKNTKMFQSSEVILASYPTLQDFYPLKIDNEEIDTTRGVFWSDNEFLISLKTKTLKEQMEIINLLERTLNIVGKKFIKEDIQAFGIAKIEIEKKQDGDEMETAKLYFHIRVQEGVLFNKPFILEAVNIICKDDDDQEDVSFYDDMERTKAREKYLSENVIFQKKKTTNLPYDDSLMADF